MKEYADFKLKIQGCKYVRNWYRTSKIKVLGGVNSNIKIVSTSLKIQSITAKYSFNMNKPSSKTDFVKKQHLFITGGRLGLVVIDRMVRINISECQQPTNLILGGAFLFSTDCTEGIHSFFYVRHFLSHHISIHIYTQ